MSIPIGDLKPCPFCKGKAHTSAVCTRINVVFFKKFKWTVKCETEGCMAFYGCSFYRTEAEAVAAWNTRAERTCHDKSTGKLSLFWCSECDAAIDGFIDVSGHPRVVRFCPYCGARVERGE